MSPSVSEVYASSKKRRPSCRRLFRCAVNLARRVLFVFRSAGAADPKARLTARERASRGRAPRVGQPPPHSPIARHLGSGTCHPPQRRTAATSLRETRPPREQRVGGRKAMRALTEQAGIASQAQPAEVTFSVSETPTQTRAIRTATVRMTLATTATTPTFSAQRSSFTLQTSQFRTAPKLPP